ncbi:hypothetical protein DFH06DRAFT_461800 [Mycena polygramma]|nr:hypothetical protein DFH06DRAFT_461800 [Mycena polygramma]
MQYHTSHSPSPLHASPHMQYHSAHTTANVHHSPLYGPRTHTPTHGRSPRLPSMTLDNGELARRHTPVGRAPLGSGSVRPSSPRTRSQTEPSGFRHEQQQQLYVGELPSTEAERERQMQRERGHARKSSAYAALAALSGLGAGHPSSSSRFAHAQAQSAFNPSGQPPTPGSTPPLSADVRDEVETSESDEGEGEDEEEEEEMQGEGRRRRGGKLLTPPATPPRCSLVVVAGLDGPDPHAHAHAIDEGMSAHDRPTFNARKASAQCRQLEGYVSFAAVEGLGEPPSPGPDGDLDDDEAGKRKRGSLGSGIVGLWRGGFW